MNKIKAIDQIIKDLEKLIDRYWKKSDKELAKMKKPYIIVQGQKVSTQEELFDFWESGYITSSALYERCRDRLQEVSRPAQEKTVTDIVLEMLIEIRKDLKKEKDLIKEEEQQKEA